MVERCEWYAMYETGNNALRDETIETFNTIRLIFDDGLQRKIQNFMLTGYERQKPLVDD